ncbi:MAG: histidinol-phosphatase, partial [Candidatus Thorarchaeota archaeon]
MIDYHIHPNFSLDAKGTIEEFCQSAVEQGLKEICFTTHLDADPEREDCVVSVRGEIVDVKSSRWLEEYESTIRDAGDKFADYGLIVRLGVEVDYFEEMIPNLPDRFHSTDFDFIIGSVHLIDHLAISLEDEANQLFEKYGLTGLGERYFSLIRECIESGYFDVIGHIDIYRRYGEKFYSNEIHSLWHDHVKDIASLMMKHNVGFEINTAWLRRGHTEPMPARALINALISHGVTTVTVGSDAHAPSEVGMHIDTALKILAQNNLDSPAR